MATIALPFPSLPFTMACLPAPSRFLMRPPSSHPRVIPPSGEHPHLHCRSYRYDTCRNTGGKAKDLMITARSHPLLYGVVILLVLASGGWTGSFAGEAPPLTFTVSSAAPVY